MSHRQSEKKLFFCTVPVLTTCTACSVGAWMPLPDCRFRYLHDAQDAMTNMIVVTRTQTRSLECQQQTLIQRQDRQEVSWMRLSSDDGEG